MIVMNQFKLFFKSIGYSVKLIYRSSGLLLLIYFILSISGATLGLFGTYALKYILDNLSEANQKMSLVCAFSCDHAGEHLGAEYSV